ETPGQGRRLDNPGDVGVREAKQADAHPHESRPLYLPASQNHLQETHGKKNAAHAAMVRRTPGASHGVRMARRDGFGNSRAEIHFVLGGASCPIRRRNSSSSIVSMSSSRALASLEPASCPTTT